MTQLWPMEGLDVESLLAGGFTPTPFRQYVVKVHSRCNLACDYCYLYEMADTTWRSRPHRMSEATAERFCQRVVEHVTGHGIERVSVVFHGGEPLLAGSRTLVAMADRLRRSLPAGTRASFAVQTNGVLLDEPMLAELTGQGIRVGISLDGDSGSTARHRRFRDGRSSHDAVTAALRLLSGPAHRAGFAGLLSVIDLAAEPVSTYESLVRFGPPQVDFLLPHANWSRPPLTDPAGRSYGRWLAEVFDRWYDAPVWETDVRLFSEIINLLLGGRSTTEQIGLSPVPVVVVDTDGSLEQVDSLRSTYHGAAATGLNVHTDSFDAALRHPAILARQIGPDALGPVCGNCAIRRVCGGGYYPHRYHAVSGFRNPSVYCADLRFLIGHITERVSRDVKRLREGAARIAEPDVNGVGPGPDDPVDHSRLPVENGRWKISDN